MKGPFTSFVKEEEFCGGLALEATCRIPLPQRCHEEGGGVPLNMSPEVRTQLGSLGTPFWAGTSDQCSPIPPHEAVGAAARLPW